MSNPLRVILNGLIPFIAPGSNQEGDTADTTAVESRLDVEGVSSKKELQPTVQDEPPIRIADPSNLINSISHRSSEPPIHNEPDSKESVARSHAGISLQSSLESPIPPVEPLVETPIEPSPSLSNSSHRPEQNDSKGRKLRSQDKQSSTATNPSLFYFNLAEIGKRSTEYWDLPLQLGFDKQQSSKKDETTQHPPSNLVKPEIYEYKPPEISKWPNNDPLSDEVYEIYHRKMERDEKGIQRIEREKTALEVDAMTAQKELLEGQSWKRDILRITAINNPNDQEELEIKRQLTIKEIEMYLTRYQTWKRKEIHARNNKDTSTMSASPEPRMILRLPTSYGLAKRDSQSPTPSNIVSRGSTSSKTIDSPTTTPSQSHKIPTPQKHFVSFFRPYTVRPRFDQLARRSHRKSELLAFGCQLPDISTQEFDIPSEWKTWKESGNAASSS